MSIHLGWHPLTVILASIVLASGHPASGGAQGSAVLDEGTLSVSRGGAPVGRESFRIIRAPAPGGQVFLATGTSVLGDTRASTRLGTDSSGVPVSYEADHSQRGQLVQRLNGRGRPGRFSMLVRTRTGESAREYMLENGALLIDEDVFHQYYFVPLAAARQNAAVIVPRSAQQSRARIEERGTDSVDVAGRRIAGRRYALVGDSTSEVWIDEQGRLLKVSIPEKGVVAVRDDPPR